MRIYEEGKNVAHTIERAQSDDLASVLRLLERHGLPLDGASQFGEVMVVARDAGQVVGAAALELYAEGALLRSVVVDVSVQGHGIGRQLTAAALALANELDVPMVFLLTTTAAEFFPRFGFERISREDVPQSVRASVEFQSACPASAVVMRRMVNRS
jgi:amino-acid N-acetyltransferase